MGRQIKQVKWDDLALKSFIDILNYIKLKSPQNANLLKTRILNLIKNLPANPEMYRVDELKNDNDGSFRVFNRDSIRVSYKIETSIIIITRVKHSSQEPISY
ncbi:MAG: type II toxin-antitoxin system RelE/ParE family toxin [Bacteroidia bacterium]